MAMFHFRLKSDKKPDGTKISAVHHVDYIRREGTFAYIDFNLKFGGNAITSAEKSDALGRCDSLLYHSDNFGSIKNSSNGIELTENASPTTIAVALILAEESFNHQPLILRGSHKFKISVLDTALLFNLNISFADHSLQNNFIHRKELIHNERQSFTNNGGLIVSKRHFPKPHSSVANAKSIETASKIGLCLPSLSQLNLVHSESQGTDLLLQNDESRQLEHLSKKYRDHVRWDFSSERKQLAERTAKKILSHIETHMDQVFAASHVEYINRENAFEHRGGCIFHSHKLPKWANDDPKKFFKAADKYEGKGNRRYMEIEFALPNELTTVKQYRQIIDAFIDKHLKDHYFAYAIHDKIGAMSNGQHHPHVHIMFSERLIDDVEKIKERDACNFFKYPARKKKDGSDPTFEEKFKHGAPKNRLWAEKSFLSILRAEFAQIQNDVLAKNGFSIRVDHRSLKAQKAEAERNGDTFLARLFNRIPEEYIGIISSQDDDNSKLKRLKDFRNLRNQHYNLIFKLDALTTETAELETKDAATSSITKAKDFIDSQNCYSTQIRSAIAEVNKWKRAVISYHDAEEQAKLEYMTPSERELWHKFFESIAQKRHLEDFLKSLRKPKDSQVNALNAYNDIVAGVHKKIATISSAISLMKKSIAEIQSKLDSPDCRKNILIVTHKILQNNAYSRKMLKRAIDNLNLIVAECQSALVDRTLNSDDKNIFQIREVYDIIRKQFFSLKKQYAKALDLKLELQSKLISPQRAILMSEDIFCNGDFKKLQADIRQYKKSEQLFVRNLADYNRREQLFLQRDWSAEDSASFFQEKYSLAKQKILLDLEKQRLANLNIALENRRLELDSRCHNIDAQEKIQLIASGILRKNFKFVKRLEQVESQLKQLTQCLQHTQKQLDVLKLNLSKNKNHVHYKLLSSDNISIQTTASVIADAILREPQAIQLVARSFGNSLEIDKTWELMSELDKDEIICKKIIREL